MAARLGCGFSQAAARRRAQKTQGEAHRETRQKRESKRGAGILPASCGGLRAAFEPFAWFAHLAVAFPRLSTASLRSLRSLVAELGVRSPGRERTQRLRREPPMNTNPHESKGARTFLSASNRRELPKRTRMCALLACGFLRFFVAIPPFVWFGYFVVASGGSCASCDQFDSCILLPVHGCQPVEKIAWYAQV